MSQKMDTKFWIRSLNQNPIRQHILMWVPWRSTPHTHTHTHPGRVTYLIGTWIQLPLQRVMKSPFHDHCCTVLLSECPTGHDHSKSFPTTVERDAGQWNTCQRCKCFLTEVKPHLEDTSSPPIGRVCYSPNYMYMYIQTMLLSSEQFFWSEGCPLVCTLWDANLRQNPQSPEQKSSVSVTDC